MVWDVAWNAWGVPALLALLFTWGLGAFVLLSRPEGVQNRRLTLQLFLEGFTVGVLHGAVWFLTDPSAVYALVGTAIVMVWVKLWTYFNFLATLDTPLARPIRPRLVRYGLLGVVLLAATSWFIAPGFYIGGLAPVPVAPWMFVPGTGFETMAVLWALMWLAGLTLAVSAMRRARTTIGRRQARAYAISFGFRDIAFAVWVFVLLTLPPNHPLIFHALVAPAFIWMLYTPMVGYAILRTQLFDIDIKVKWTLRRSTVAGIFVAVFFVVSEGAQEFFADQAGFGPWLGILAAGALVFAISPLQRLAERVSDAAMPGVEDTREYRERRKETIYRAQLEELLMDANVTAKERGALLRLQEDLGLDGDQANRLERDVLEDLRLEGQRRAVPA